MSKPASWLLVVIWMAVIYWFSDQPVIPGSQINTLDFIIKKTAHIGEYAILYLLLLNALGFKQMQNAFLLGLAYAFTDELHQLFTPGRTGMLRDVLTFDTLGLLVGVVIAEKYKQWKHL
jgi:VanZ family protein